MFQSTHSLRSATRLNVLWDQLDEFQSTHSLRSATDDIADFDQVLTVSIHALLAECDLFQPAALSTGRCFNPRTPCGVRQWYELQEVAFAQFQSTHSLRLSLIHI